MTSTTSSTNLRTAGTSRVRASVLPIGYHPHHLEDALGSPPRLHPGAAIAFAIAAAVAMLAFVEIMVA